MGNEMSQNMTWVAWIRSLRNIASKAKLEYLFGDCASDHLDAWREGRTPRQAMQDLYEDADCPTHNEQQ